MSSQHTLIVWLLDTLVTVNLLRGRTVKDFLLYKGSSSLAADNNRDILCCIVDEPENNVS